MNKKKLSAANARNNTNGINVFNTRSLKIFNGNVKSLIKLNANKNNGMKNNASMIKLKNGIKLGRPNKIDANNGLNNPRRILNNKIGKLNSVKKTASAVPNASNNPRPLINSGATTKMLNSVNRPNGNVINPCNANSVNKKIGNPIKKVMMCESNPAPSANKIEIKGRTNKKYGIVKKIHAARSNSPSKSNNN